MIHSKRIYFSEMSLVLHLLISPLLGLSLSYSFYIFIVSIFPDRINISKEILSIILLFLLLNLKLFKIYLSMLKEKAP